MDSPRGFPFPWLPPLRGEPLSTHELQSLERVWACVLDRSIQAYLAILALQEHRSNLLIFWMLLKTGHFSISLSRANPTLTASL